MARRPGFLPALPLLLLAACGSPAPGGAAGHAPPDALAQPYFQARFQFDGAYELTGVYSVPAVGAATCGRWVRQLSSEMFVPWGRDLAVAGHTIRVAVHGRVPAGVAVRAVRLDRVQGGIDIDAAGFDSASAGATGAIVLNPDASGSYSFSRIDDGPARSSELSGWIRWTCSMATGAPGAQDEGAGSID